MLQAGFLNLQSNTSIDSEDSESVLDFASS